MNKQAKKHSFKNPAKRVSKAQQKQHTDVRREKQITVTAHGHMQIVATFLMGLSLWSHCAELASVWQAKRIAQEYLIIRPSF